MGVFLQIISKVISHFKENRETWHGQRDLPGLFGSILQGEFQVLDAGRKT